MRTELPVCKRCCCCFPLRYGLITWAYFKLIASSLVSILLMISLYNMVERSIAYKISYYTNHLVAPCITLVILLTDIALNTVFLIGGHTKNEKLLRVYYIYNTVLWVLSVLLVVGLCFIMIGIVYQNNILIFLFLWLVLAHFFSSFVIMVIQTYFLLLLRSEIIKLNNNCEFRFINNAAEAECNMNYYKDGLLDEKKGSEDVYERGTYDSEDEKLCRFKEICQTNVDDN